jgi:hypothetical protein
VVLPVTPELVEGAVPEATLVAATSSLKYAMTALASEDAPRNETAHGLP